MKNNQLINKNIDITNFLSIKDEELFSISHFTEEEKVVVSNRKEYFEELLAALNDEDIKSIGLEGFQGTGKSTLLKTLHHFLDNNAYSHLYNCTQISTLDDMMMNLFKYMSKIARKQPQKTNIDAQLMNLLKNFSAPLVLVIDSTEHILDQEFKLNEDICNFFDYLISLPNVKLIVCGKKTGLNFKPDTRIKISGLDEEQTSNLLKANGVNNISKQVLFEIFEVTRGYPATIFLFITAVKFLKVAPFDLIQSHSNSNLSFEEFIIKKLLKTIPDDSKIVLYFLSVVRHPVIMEVLVEVLSNSNSEKAVSQLREILFLAKFNREIYLEDFVRKCVYEEIVHNDKIKYHKLLADFYSTQIPLPPEKRVLKLSRNSLHSEKFYHFRACLKLKEEFENVGRKSAYIVDTNKNKPLDKNTLSPGLLSYMSMAEASKRRPIPVNNGESQQAPIVNSPHNFIDTDIELSDEEKQLMEQISESTSEESLVFEGLTTAETPEVEYLYNEEDDVDFLLEKASTETNTDKKIELYSKAILLAEDDLLPKIYLDLSAVYTANSNHEAERTCLEKALHFFVTANNTSEILATKLKIANSNRLAYKHEEALKEYFNLIEKFRANNSETHLIHSYIGIGDIYNYRLDYDNAIQYYIQALNLSKQNNSAELIIETAFKIGLIYDDILDEKNAQAYYQRCAEVEQDAAPSYYLASALSNLASIYQEKGNIEASIELYKKSLKNDVAIENIEGQYSTLTQLAELYLQENDKVSYLDTLRKALDAAKLEKDVFHISTSYFSLGEFYEAENQMTKAVKSLLMAKKIIQTTVSTDSNQKIDRKLHKIQSKIGAEEFKKIIDSLKIKHTND